MTTAILEIKVNSSGVTAGKKALDDLSAAGTKADKSTDTLTKSTTTLTNAARTAAGMLGTLGLALGVREIIQMADAWKSAENQLRLVTSSASELASVQKQLMGLANDTRSTFESTASLYSRLSRATTEMGLSQKELLGITTTINQSFAISGATATEAAAAITQLSQGLAAGALRGDEFNSVAEQAPGIMRAIADSLNMTVGELRAFAAEGGITADIVVTALQKASGAIANDFAKANLTFGQSIVIAKNNMLELVGTSVALQSGLSGSGKAIIFLSENLDKLVLVLGAAALAFTANLIPGIIAAGQQMVITGAASTSLATTLKMFGGVGGIGAIAAAGMYLFVQAAKDAADAADRLVKSIDDTFNAMFTLDAKGLAAGAEALREQIAALERQSEVYQEAALAGAFMGDAIRRNAAELEAAKALLAGYETQLQSAADGTGRFTVATSDAELYVRAMESGLQDVGATVLSSQRYVTLMTGEVKTLSKAEKDAAKHAEELADNTRALNGIYASTAVAVSNTAEAYVELMGISAQASKANIQGVADWRAAINDLPGTMVKVGETNSEVSEQAARDWAQFRDSFSDSLADMLMDGGNVFDDLGKSFERMLYKMAGDLIASGVMSFLTGQKGGFSFAGSLAGSGTTGTLVSAGLSKFAPGLAGALGIGGGAAVSTAGLTAAQAAAINLPAAGAAGGAGLAGVGSALASAVPWALAAAAVYKIFAKESTPSFNAGLLLHDVPGAKANQKFDVDPFASGLDPVGFMRDQTKEAATAVIDTFRALDKTVVDIAAKAGLTVSANAGTFRNFGLAETGLNSGSGVFLGSAGEDGKPGVSLETQLDQYTKSLIATLTGQLDGEVLNKVLSSGNAEQMIAALNDELKMTEDAAVAATDSVTVFTEALIESAESLAATKALENINMNTGGGSSVSFGAAQYLGGGAQQAGTHYSNGKLVQAFNSALPMTVDYNPWANSQFEELRNLYSSDGSHANGLDYVPFDGYKATLHKGERVQTSSSAKDSDATASEIRDLKQVVQSLLTSINSNTRSASNRLDEMNSEGIYSRSI